LPTGSAVATPAALTGLTRLAAVAADRRVAGHRTRTDAGVACRVMSLPPCERPNFLGLRQATRSSRRAAGTRVRETMCR
jgi:hypothetical protein